MRLSKHHFGVAAFFAAACLAVLAALGAALFIESRSASGIRKALDLAGYDWADVTTDGLLVTLSGTAPTDADRFQAIVTAGTIADPEQVIDKMELPRRKAVTASEFSVEILRNGQGISLIGLIPVSTDRQALVARLTAIVGEGRVADMLESADHPTPTGWDAALAFGEDALRVLPRSKISVSATHVAITAIAESIAQRARLEADLARKAPKSLRLSLDISAPRPVIAPFTLRFLADVGGMRFDACSADTEVARERILAAAMRAGLQGKTDCTIGLGVPSPDWATAAEMAIAAIGDLGAGAVTISDADVSLIAGAGTAQPDFDRVVGELESNLPQVFSLHAAFPQDAPDGLGQGATREFSATLTATGRVELRGRLTDELARDAVENFARARFGQDTVFLATRYDPDLPVGWTLRALTAIEVVAEIGAGTATVRPDLIRVDGVSGSQDARAAVSRILAARLGGTQEFAINIRYDESLDPVLALPTERECVDEINGFIAASDIRFEPGSAIITPAGRPTMDQIAVRMADCGDYAMEVAGHTDAQGREEMNLRLSQQRAESVIAALLERRVLTSGLSAIGYGETRPIADNETEAGREANRRIEFALIVPPPASGGGAAQSGMAAENAPAPAAPEAGAAAAPLPELVEQPEIIAPRPRPAGLAPEIGVAPAAGD